MPKTEPHEIIIIGSGQAGTPLAAALARSGWKTALVEREHVGGTCVNEGCTPTKTMVASARIAYLARRGKDYGVETAPPTIDLVRVRQRKRDIVASFRGGSERRLSEAGVEVFAGEGSFTGPQEVEVHLNDGGTRRLTAPRIVIDTGGRPARPPIPGLDRVPALDSTSIMELDTVPEHLLVLGGGYIGLEFAQMFRRFGAQVTVVELGKKLLGHEDDDVAEAVLQIMREDGLDILLETAALAVEPRTDGTIELRLRTPAGERTVAGSHLLVAAGRTPNTDRLNLPAAGVTADRRGFIPVNERLETKIPGIYATGDVNGGPAFTHIAYDDFRILRTNLLEGGGASTAGRLLPYVVFIDPQLGRVGMTEEQARAQGRPVRIARMPMSHVARALEMDESRGFMKAVVDGETEQILGFAVLGVEGGEVMAMAQLAMMGRLPYTALREAIFAHPTLAECFNNLFATLE